MKIKNVEYEPLYEIAQEKSGKKTHYVSRGFCDRRRRNRHVHIAPMHGEDDYNVGVQYDLPIIPLLDSGGHFNENTPRIYKGLLSEKGEKYIKEDLEKED